MFEEEWRLAIESSTMSDDEEGEDGESSKSGLYLCICE